MMIVVIIMFVIATSMILMIVVVVVMAQRIAFFQVTILMVDLCTATIDNVQVVTMLVSNENRSTCHMLRGHLEVMSRSCLEGTTHQQWRVEFSEYGSMDYDPGSDTVAFWDVVRGAMSVDTSLRRIEGETRIADTIYGVPLSKAVTSIALAPTYDLLYYVDSSFKYIGVILVKGHLYKDIITRVLGIPYAIVVEEDLRIFFWSNIGAVPQIERVEFSGRQRSPMFPIPGQLTRPTSLSLDRAAERIYIIDNGVLRSSDFFGKYVVEYEDPKGLSESMLDIGIWKNFLIARTSNESLQIFGLKDKKLDPKCSFELPGVKDIRRMGFHTTKPVKKRQNPCNTSDCEQFCFPVSDTEFTCSCAFGLILKEDGKSCGFAALALGRLLVIDASRGWLLQMDLRRRKADILFKVAPGWTGMFTHVSYRKEELFYFFVNITKILYLYSYTTGKMSHHQRFALPLRDIAGDSSSGCVYAAEEDGGIYKITHDSHKLLIIETFKDEVYKLVVDSEKGSLFYSFCGESRVVAEFSLKTERELSRMYFDFCVFHMAMDFLNNYAFFAGAKSIIVRYNFLTGTREEFFEFRHPIVDMCTDPTHLYIRTPDFLGIMEQESKLFVYNTSMLFIGRGDLDFILLPDRDIREVSKVQMGSLMFMALQVAYYSLFLGVLVILAMGGAVATWKWKKRQKVGMKKHQKVEEKSKQKEQKPEEEEEEDEGDEEDKEVATAILTFDKSPMNIKAFSHGLTLTGRALRNPR